jgi:hypothetical protein
MHFITKCPQCGDTHKHYFGTSDVGEREDPAKDGMTEEQEGLAYCSSCDEKYAYKAILRLSVETDSLEFSS